MSMKERNSVGKQFDYQLVALDRPFHVHPLLIFILHPLFCNGRCGHGAYCILLCVDNGTVIFQSLASELPRRPVVLREALTDFGLDNLLNRGVIAILGDNYWSRGLVLCVLLERNS